MTFAPYLSFDGDCAEAMRFYADLFGADDLDIMTFGDAPEPAQGVDPNRVMHAAFTLRGGTLMGSDAPRRRPTPEGFAVTYVARDVDEARRVFDALAEGGETKMPFAATFFSSGFGICRDRFGTPWMISAAAAD